MVRRVLLCALTLGGLALAQPAVIRDSVRFVAEQELVRVRVLDGVRSEEFVQSPRTVLPGDVLREQVTLHNVSGGRLARVEVAVPVPRETRFSGGVTPNSARWPVAYSVDGGRTYSLAPQRRVAGGTGNVTRLETAPPGSYTHVRWVVTDLRPDETVRLSFRVTVRSP